MALHCYAECHGGGSILQYFGHSHSPMMHCISAVYVVYLSQFIVCVFSIQTVDILENSLSAIDVEVIDKRFGSDEGIGSIAELFVSLNYI